MCVCVCLPPRLALLLLLAGCRSGSSFLASSFGADSYPQRHSHGHTYCFTHSFFVCFLSLGLQVCITTAMASTVLYCSSLLLNHSKYVKSLPGMYFRVPWEEEKRCANKYSHRLTLCLSTTRHKTLTSSFSSKILLYGSQLYYCVSSG